MSTPSAKRRRVDAANAVLRKPFHSPVIRRPGAGTGESFGSPTTATSRTPDATTGGAPSQLGAYSPSSPSTLRQPGAAASAARGVRPARSLTALRQTPAAANARTSLSPLLKFKTPLLSNSNSSSRGSALKRKKTSGMAATEGGDDNDDDDDHGHGHGHHGAAGLLALVGSHSHAASDAVIKDLDRQLETARQARRIEEASARRRPGEAVDQELRDLVARWKGAGRLAAEEMFEIVRERVEGAGGTRAWRDMRRRQMEGWRGGWDEVEKGGRGDDDGDNDGDDRVEEGEEEEKEDEEDESEFNMAEMLLSLNIDSSLLGYDEEEEKWID